MRDNINLVSIISLCNDNPFFGANIVWLRNEIDLGWKIPWIQGLQNSGCSEDEGIAEKNDPDHFWHYELTLITKNTKVGLWL